MVNYFYNMNVVHAHVLFNRTNFIKLLINLNNVFLYITKDIKYIFFGCYIDLSL